MGVQCCPLVTTTKQSVVFGRGLAADAPGPRRQLAQWLEGDAKAFGSHGWSARFKILIPEIKSKNSTQHATHFYSFSLPYLTHYISSLYLPGSGLLDPVFTVNFPTERNLSNLVRKGIYNSFYATNGTFELSIRLTRINNRSPSLFQAMVPLQTC